MILEYSPELMECSCLITPANLSLTNLEFLLHNLVHAAKSLEDNFVLSKRGPQ